MFPNNPTRVRRTTAALGAAALVIALAACGEDTTSAQDPADPADQSTSPAAEETSEAATDTPSTSETDGGPETVDVTVYYVTETPQGPRLAREDTAGEGTDPLTGTVSALGEAPLDPDYSSLLAGAPIDAVSFDGVGDDGVIQVQVSEDSWNTALPGMSHQEAELAVQQLVYTLQANAGAKAPVEFSLGGHAVPFLGVEGPVTAADPLEILSLVNVLSPSDGAAFAPDATFTAEGLANSFEATVPWEIRDADGEVVKDGFATAEGWMDKLYPWSTEVDLTGLEPGSYTFVAMTDDPSGGAEGAGPSEDSKQIVIE